MLKTNMLLLFTTTIAVVVLAGCGGSGSNGGTIPIDPIDPSVNRPPVITSLSPDGTTSDPVPIKIGSSQHLVVAASDPDNDLLTYTWTVDNGQVTGSSPEADFTAPAAPAIAVVTVTVSDGHDHVVSADCCFKVYDPGSIGPIDPPENHPPVISSLVADPAAVEVGETSTVTAVVSDPDGDTVTYTWTTNGGGILSDSGNSAVWKAPSVAGSYTVTLSVSDGHNTAVSKSIAIPVEGIIDNPVTNGLSATYIQNDHVNAHPDLSKGTVVFTRVDPNINFDWGRKAPDPLLITLPETGNGHDFGVVWNGFIKCEEPGVYTFRARYDDGFRLWISGDDNQMRQVIDGWYTGPAIIEGQIELEGSKWYKIEVQYFEDEDRSYVQLYWLTPQAATWEIVPTSALRTPD